jgi:hypothetical protein
MEQMDEADHGGNLMSEEEEGEGEGDAGGSCGDFIEGCGMDHYSMFGGEEGPPLNGAGGGGEEGDDSQCELWRRTGLALLALQEHLGGHLQRLSAALPFEKALALCDGTIDADIATGAHCGNQPATAAATEVSAGLPARS